MSDDDDDVLGREVSIRASVDQSGIDVSARSRAVAALDRLIGAIFDWPASYFEGKAAKLRLVDDIDRQMIAAQTAAVAEQVQAQPCNQILLSPLDRENTRKLENRAGVAFETYEELKRLPPPSCAGEPTDAAVGAETINDDWMNAFLRYAEDASSEQLQQLWGRVLAGEVRRPGSFSRRTLRFMADLDKDVAVLCEAVAGRVFRDLLIAGPDWNAGPNLDKALALQALGLVAGAGGVVTRSITLDANGRSCWQAQTMALGLQGTPNAQVELDALTLTELGREVFSLVAEPNELETLRVLGAAFDKQHLTKVEIGGFSEIPGGRIVIEPSETVYERSTILGA